VAGGGFSGVERGGAIDVWIPYSALAPLLGYPIESLRRRESLNHGSFIARLRAGASAAAAEAQLATILSRLAESNVEYAEYLADIRPAFHAGVNIPPTRRDSVQASLRVLAGVVVLVLIVACANVANLLLVRNVKRRGSLAMHHALGASRSRIARQQLLESLSLASIATVLGLGIAWLIGVLFQGERLVGMPAFEGLALDWHVLIFACGASAVTAALFGTIPALLAGRFNLTSALKAAGQRDTGRLAIVRAMLSSGQIALTLTLLIGGVLLTRTVHNLYAVETNLDIENVLALPISPPADLRNAALDAWQRDLITTIKGIPGVVSVALDLYGPHGAQAAGHVRMLDAQPADAIQAQVIPVTPGWFELFDVGVIQGRTFREADWRAGSNAVLLTAALARHLFGTENVVGRRILGGFREAEDLEIVGVVEDMRMAHSPDELQEALFVTYDRAPGFALTALVRTTSINASVIRDIRTAVEAILPDKAVPDPGPLTNRVDAIHSERRVFSHLLAVLSGLAALLAAIGLYGVIAFNVAGRRREFGIRLALGARPTRIGRLVARYAARIVGAGLAVGFVGAYAFSRVLENRLFGIAPTEPGAYVFGALLFATVALIACIAPVLSAVRVNPVVTLKGE
jgi:predicted permease